MTDIFVHRTPSAYVTSDDLPLVKDYVTEMAGFASTVGGWSFLSGQVTLDTGKVASIANRKSGAPALSQATAGRRGSIVTSSDLRREVLSFPDDGVSKDYAASGIGFDSASAWTMAALFKPVDYVNRMVCGVQVSATDWASLYLTQSGAPADLIVCRYADMNAQQTPATAGWQTVIGAGLPSAPAKLEVNGIYSLGGASPSGTPATDTFAVGDTGFKFIGEQAEVWLFQEDLFLPAAAARLALVREFLTSIRVGAQ